MFFFMFLLVFFLVLFGSVAPAHPEPGRCSVIARAAAFVLLLVLDFLFLFWA